MTSKQLVSIWVALVAIGVIAGWALVSSHQAPKAAGTRFPNGLSADGTSPVAGQVRGSTLTITGASTLGGTLTLTTSNTATSSAVVGCLQSYATSTATPQKLQFVASTTAPTNGSGIIPVISFGTCP